ncbi:MAG: endolytic transglycosylase MltG [Coriobacteriia bacterium]
MSGTSNGGDDRRVPRPAPRRRTVPSPVSELPAGSRADLGRATVGEIRDRRRILAAIVVLVGVVLAVVVPLYGTYALLLRPQVDVAAGAPVQLEIPQGSDTRAIAGILAGAGVIDNAAMFRLRARVEEIDGKLRPGVYDLETGMRHREVVDLLLAGPAVAYVTVTVPEGFTIDQIAERLESEVGIPATEFRDLATTRATAFAADRPYLAEITNGSLEGYLFPKTYRIVESSDATEVANMMLDQFEQEFATVDLSLSASKNLTPHDVVIIASMIEREARIAAERPVVSSVIYNRLRKKMKLEIDATIEYILPGTRPRLLNKHLKIDSPYNTYMYAGLPEGPISNPGLASLQAAAAPADTSYLYYVLTSKDGSHTFTETHEEFLKAKEKSREVVP